MQALVQGRHGNPFAVLGMHGEDPPVLRTFQPDAARVAVLDARTGERVAQLERIEPAGLFAGTLEGRSGRFAYRLEVEHGGDTRLIDDPYGFPPLLGEMDVHLLAEGRHLRIYEKLGAHPHEMEGVAGTSFAVWAPSASRVSVVGPFNGWDGRRHVMRRRVECGVWEIFLPGIERGEPYKYEILGPRGEMLPLKADPVALRAEHPPATASVVHGLARHDWQDAAWMARRAEAQSLHAPISVYECHLGSWARIDGEGGRYLSYLELADRLVPYLEDLGFTHVELLPVSEYPFDGSWGYQPIGLFAPTIRHGTPEEFAAFVDRCHEAGIGVIIDWVPGHFPTDAHGLGRFDGTALYEHEDPRQGFHQDWNTLIYNYGRTEVANFLHANALYWLDRFHIDGLRVDAVASMLYLDYSRKADEWVPNRFGGNENLEAVDFLRRLNELVFGEHEGATTLAEESTAWPSVSRPTWLGGLGFGYKWNMGWMHDTLGYISKDTVHRKYHQNNLTFGLLYAFTENFVLPLSHDEVVHGKGSLIGKMPGDRWQRFANLRAYYGFMWTHPGKKLMFMGCEIAQEREWSHDRGLDWHLLEDPMHQGVQRLIRDLNAVYRGFPALHDLDCEPHGFEWIDASDSEQSVISYLRKDRAGNWVAVVCNFTPVVRPGYRVGLPEGGAWREIINTDSGHYGGSGVLNAAALESTGTSWHGRPHSIELTLPPLATVVLAPAAP
ncbi:1,4-alpha-glucan branching protein GlgB [Marinimicrococcus flavescens]|uniref:1,4-alpha-glucan branching enzyme GlgB n=1 Tax=Marinimicrococcus flavescens TaxID=3031815 RepID=A0AAP3V028_9PROT|nr:1,4-alpha-glucan branching protein GlgB [Marinimicrococcus flavescens]